MGRAGSATVKVAHPGVEESVAVKTTDSRIRLGVFWAVVISALAFPLALLMSGALASGTRQQHRPEAALPGGSTIRSGQRVLVMAAVPWRVPQQSDRARQPEAAAATSDWGH